MAGRENEKNARHMPLIPLRGIVVYPHMILHFDVGRFKSIKAIEEAMLEEQLIFLVAQRDPSIEDPEPTDIYAYGTIAKIKQLLRLPGDTIRVLVEGIGRAKIAEMVQTEPFYMARIKPIKVYSIRSGKTDIQALARQVVEHFEQYAKLSGKISPDATLSITAVDDLTRLPDIIASNLSISVELKQSILEELSPKKRLERILDILVHENEILEIEKNISTKVRQQIDKNQREYYLREQLKAIQKELGESEGISSEVEEYKERIEKLDLPEEARKKAMKEVDRLSRMHSSSAESGVIRTYLDTILELPWNKKTEERLDLQYAAEVLERDHYGLQRVKERILEYLAVRKLRNGLHGPIICLVGPPGVGKTSIARSIAESLNRNYVRMSLGGVRDEAEIRGHRRTYVGSMPGRIISALRQAGSCNPLILLDEIDKMSSDFRGDPSAALLEVLDTEQNKDFRDHYLELPFDLSDVMFITTANYKEAIPQPLLDRMEVIDISGYTEDEKVCIAARHLIPKQLAAHGLDSTKVRFDESGIREIVVHYTREAGVRNLERSIASVIRKAAKLLVSGEKKIVRVTARTVKNFLGGRKYLYDMANEVDEVGIVRGLAWTPVGGDTMAVEVNIMPGEGVLELTGQLGDVMKESARIARSYIRSVADQYGLDAGFHKKFDMHIHVPEGAIPKDGPSAGITLATAMMSAISGIPVKRNIAMTGEITLRGRILPIGGLKEKVLAAHRAGVEKVIIPHDNIKDIEEIPENIRKKVELIPVSQMDEVFRLALVRMPDGHADKKMTKMMEMGQAAEEAAVGIEH
ncbi:MAG TPA: endopeptidase La [Thermoclostridium sp.]|nr:endopeptidase La [Clostridiaceae bacterium]HOQ76071.1 endopeptidase La [Thermoclostridium sp.]HPU45002.1 endopeptidase La [Thermoclostridium sp.]